MRILIVDDHEDTAELFAMTLRDRGHDVTVVSTVADAIRVVSDGCCEVVVCDLRLPDGNGWDLMRTLASEHKMTGIALSGLGYAADIERSRAAGFARHLTKPVDLETLIHAVESLSPCA